MDSKRIKLDISGPSESKPVASILKLNDDCLYKILSYLTLVPLCSIGSTCRRLNHIAQSFYSHYSTLNSDSLWQYDLCDVKMVVNQICSHVKSFHVSECQIIDDNMSEIADDTDYMMNIINLIFKYCQNLCHARMGGDIEQLYNGPIKRFLNSKPFQNLTSIQLCCNLINAPEILVKMKNLKSLEFKSNNEEIKVDAFLKFRGLNCLCLDLDIEIDYSLWAQIFDNNLELKKLHLLHSLNDEILNLIFDKLIYLEDFNIVYTLTETIPEKTLMRIGDLKSLKHFYAMFIPSCLLEKLAEDDNLESLQCVVTSSKECFTKFTKLKSLNDQIMNDTLLNSLRSIGSLESLTIDYNEDITEEGFLKFMRVAPNIKFVSICDCQMDDETIKHLELLMSERSRGKLRVRYDDIDVQDFNKKDYPNLIITRKCKDDESEGSYDEDFLSDDYYMYHYDSD